MVQFQYWKSGCDRQCSRLLMDLGVAAFKREVTFGATKARRVSIAAKETGSSPTSWVNVSPRLNVNAPKAPSAIVRLRSIVHQLSLEPCLEEPSGPRLAARGARPMSRLRSWPRVMTGVASSLLMHPGIKRYDSSTKRSSPSPRNCASLATQDGILASGRESR